jgi:diguanylate cyclase (GGDEF)-like protein
VGSAILVSVIVVILEALMMRYGFISSGQSVWWPTNGLALALLLRAERRQWPLVLSCVLLGSFLGQVYWHFPLLTDLINLTSNGLAPLLCAFFLPHFEKLEDWMQQPNLVTRFVLFALVLAPIFSGIMLGLFRNFVLHDGTFWHVFTRRSVADMLGYALFTPLVLVLLSPNAYKLVDRDHLPRTVALLLFVAIVTSLVFAQSSYALSFILASAILLVTLHLGFSAAVIAVNLLAIMATAETMRGHGPFTLGSGIYMGPRIFLLQAFLTLSMVAVFSVSVIQIENLAIRDKLSAAYVQMERLASTDALTGVTNRRRFEEMFALEWARAQRMGDSIALLLIDADHFKDYNDTFGHLAGDDCLRDLARAAQAMERRPTDLLARYGGEEFVFLLPGNTLHSAAELAESLRARLEGLHLQADSHLKRKLTISIGCAAMTPTSTTLPVSLVDASDRALYLAKQNGRNRVELAAVPQRIG